MVEPRREPLAEEIEENAAWVLRLSRALLHDPSLAEDVAQDVLAAAWERRAEVRRANSLRAWLRAVTRNIAVRVGTRERARRRIEAQAARDERAEGIAADSELRELHQRLSDAVATLAPIYRDVVVLRFFDGLPHAAIGERLGLSAPTVRQRLSRALPLLESALDRQADLDRDDWRAALARFLVPIGSGHSRRLGPVAAGVAAACLVWLLASQAGPSFAHLQAVCSVGEPIAGARIRYAGGSAVTDAEGWFELPRDAQRVVVERDDYFPLALEVDGDERDLTVAGAELEGILDVAGGSAAGSYVFLELPDGPFLGGPRPSTRVIEGGGFRFTQLPPEEFAPRLLVPTDLRVVFTTSGEILPDGIGVALDFVGPIYVRAEPR